MSFMPPLLSIDEFKKFAQPGCRLPLVGEVPLGGKTPVALYASFQKEKYRFLLESVEGGEKWARYSFIGLFPSLIFRSKPSKDKTTDPLDTLRKALTRYRYVSVPGLPRMTGGAAGLVSYDMVRFFEKIPDRKLKGVAVPDLCFMIPQILLIMDSLKQTIQILYDARIDKPSTVAAEYRRGTALIQKVARILNQPLKTSPKKRKKVSLPQWTASITSEEHACGVEKIREYIAAGDITQAVYSIRFQAKLKMDDLELYRMIRRVNPSPYLFHFKMGDLALVGASPETMVRLEDGEMVLRPIAGTRRRGKTDAEDQALAKELLADEKERAEHIMLVDLGRNDLGRVAEPGSVRVDELMKVERYSHVMHIVSNVRARLAQGRDAFDLLRATFPAGTLSGSPKIRAMQIIEELEPVRRSSYGGCAGYFSFSGNLDMAITIRSALLKNGVVTIQAGGGIVADSKPELEYKEIVNKSKAMIQAVEMVCRGE